MPLLRENILDRANYSWSSEPIYISLSNETWTAATASVEDIADQALLESNILGTVTVTEDVGNNEVDLLITATYVPTANITFSRCSLWRGSKGVMGKLSATIDGDGQTFLYTPVVGWPALADGDRVVYNGTISTLTSTVVGVSFQITGVTGQTPGAADVFFAEDLAMAAIEFPVSYTFNSGISFNIQIDGTSLTT